MARFAPLLLLLLLGWALRGARGSPWTEANTACATRAVGGRSALLSFLWLRPDGAAPVLVQSLWEARGGGEMLACALRTEPGETRRYLQLCGPGGPRRPLVRARWGPRLRRELAALDARKGACKGAASPAGLPGAPAAAMRARRARRGWTVPGTLWCGAGHTAEQPSELGVFQGPDVCCREHDKCDAHISALGFKYGMRNYRLHTISHCSCDNRFRDCLKSLNDTISNFIGTSFFDLLEIPCFHLKESEDCLEWHWWGGCKKYGMMPLAHLVDPSPYQPIDATASPLQPGWHQKPGSKGRKMRRKKVRKPSSEIQGPPILTPILTPISKLNQVTHLPGGSPPGEETVPRPPALQTTSEAGPIKMEAESLTAHPPVVFSAEETSSNETWQGERPFRAGPSVGHGQVSKPGPGLSRRCRCYQRLDRCPFQIGPNEFKYQLRNPDDRTLFHCNCTRRLARFLRRSKGPNKVEEQVLSHYISPSCFVLETLPSCRMGDENWPNCIGIGKAVLAPARHLTNRLMGKWMRDSFKVKRQEQASLEGATQLFDKCVRLVRATLWPVPR